MENKWQALEQLGYNIIEDQTQISAEALMPLYTHAYWASKRSIETVRKSLEHSYACVVEKEGKLVACMRLVTDYATFAYLCDVIVVPEHRGIGLSKWMLTHAFGRPDIKNLRRWCLMTKDAHGLYRQFGFEVSDYPERFMEVIRE